MQQRDAALNLITWLSQESHEAGSKQYRLMLMGCNPQGKKSDDEFERFQAYGDNWGELQAWFYFLKVQGHDKHYPKTALDQLIQHHQQLCPELNKHYNLYEYTTVAGVTRRWVYMGDVTPPMTLKQRLSRMGITYITPTLLKEGM